jgi:hypothetical protein
VIEPHSAVEISSYSGIKSLQDDECTSVLSYLGGAAVALLTAVFGLRYDFRFRIIAMILIR